jgi:hypothetical protein
MRTGHDDATFALLRQGGLTDRHVGNVPSVVSQSDEEAIREPPPRPTDDLGVTVYRRGGGSCRSRYVRRQASETFGREGMGTRISRTPSLWSALICSSFAQAGSGIRR